MKEEKKNEKKTISTGRFFFFLRWNQKDVAAMHQTLWIISEQSPQPLTVWVILQSITYTFRAKTLKTLQFPTSSTREWKPKNKDLTDGI